MTKRLLLALFFSTLTTRHRYCLINNISDHDHEILFVYGTTGDMHGLISVVN